MNGGELDLGDVEVDDFALWWSVFPRRRDRARAEGAYWRARRVTSAAVLLDAARRYAAESAGMPVGEMRWPVEFLRSEPWLDSASRPAATAIISRRRRRDPSKPRRAPYQTAPARALTEAEMRAQWLRHHGLTEEEFEARKGEPGWLDRIRRRGRVA